MSNHNPTRYSKQYTCTFLTALFLMALGPSALAQESQVVAKNSLSTSEQSLPAATKNASFQDINTSLAALPEADTLIYISPRRIINDAAPRVLPEKELGEMRQGLSELKQGAGIDPANIDYVVLQVRFKKPRADLNFSLPEFIAVASGDFNAEALMQLAKQAAKGKLRDESYGSKTLGLLTIEDLAREAQKTPLLNSLSEVAIVLLNGNTIALGTTAYVKAAVDAAAGKGRISPDLLSSVMRDPTALISSAGSPLNAFAKTFALLGTENNPRASRCDWRLGDFYASLTMDATSFKLRGAMNADNPDTAKIIKSLLSGLLQQATSVIKDSNAQSVLSSLIITPTDTEVLLQADVSQQAVADFIRKQAQPKKQETQPLSTSPAKPAVKRRPRSPHRVRPKS